MLKSNHDNPSRRHAPVPGSLSSRPRLRIAVATCALVTVIAAGCNDPRVRADTQYRQGEIKRLARVAEIRAARSDQYLKDVERMARRAETNRKLSPVSDYPIERTERDFDQWPTRHDVHKEWLDELLSGQPQSIDYTITLMFRDPNARSSASTGR